MRRAWLIVLDSLGIGALPDAGRFGDTGADTLGHIAQWCARPLAEGGRGRPLTLPNLVRLGLAQAAALASGKALPGCEDPIAAQARWACARELSTGKDTISGHWEMAGVPVLFEWGYFRATEQSFPAELLQALIESGGIGGVLGNCHASGTEIIARLGAEHLRSGWPIVYTSADSVLQIAAHEQQFGLERLYRLCAQARVLVDPYRIGRVIARPFSGSDAASFKRTPNRRDYAVPPIAPTLLDRLLQQDAEVIGVGKISDIFAGQGISRSIKAHGIEALMTQSRQAFDAASKPTLVFTNLVDFDQEYGHRRDVAGYAAALEHFDSLLPRALSQLSEDDLIVLCADHGNDPTWPGSDHTREHIPILALSPALTPGGCGIRDSFADIGASVAEWFGLAAPAHGRSMLSLESGQR
ncbi:MAG: phosphopentomutase [Lysobacterales bacterium]